MHKYIVVFYNAFMLFAMLVSIIIQKLFVFFMHYVFV